MRVREGREEEKEEKEGGARCVLLDGVGALRVVVGALSLLALVLVIVLVVLRNLRL